MRDADEVLTYPMPRDIARCPLDPPPALGGVRRSDNAMPPTGGTRGGLVRDSGWQHRLNCVGSADFGATTELWCAEETRCDRVPARGAAGMREGAARGGWSMAAANRQEPRRPITLGQNSECSR